MVLPGKNQSPPRPNWAKTNSWRRYLKTSSSRKLLQTPDLDASISRERRNVSFGDDEVHVFDVDLSADDESGNQALWYTVGLHGFTCLFCC